MATSDIYRVIPRWTDSASGKVLTTHWDVHPKTGITPSPSVTDMGDVVKEWWNTDYGGSAVGTVKSYYTAAIELFEVTLQRIKPFEAVVQTYTAGLPIAGTNVSQDYGPGVSVLTSLRTDYVGRSYRGRQYLPCFAENSVDNGALAGGVADGFVVNMALVVGAFDDEEMTVCVYSPTLDAARDVTEVKVDQRLRSQRRRNVRAPNYSSSGV